MGLALMIGHAFARGEHGQSTDEPPYPQGDGYYLVGGGINPPKRIAGADPVIPKAQRRGVIVFEVFVDAKGAVTKVNVFSRRPADLIKAIEAAVARWRFAPGTRGSAPVPTIHTMSLKVD